MLSICTLHDSNSQTNSTPKVNLDANSVLQAKIVSLSVTNIALWGGTLTGTEKSFVVIRF